MNSNQLDPQKALNPAYKKFTPLKKDVDDFAKELEKCISAINVIDSKGESEEHLKSPITKFLSSTFYKDNEINTRERIDLAIYLGADSSSDIGVLLEAKKPSNKSEFPKKEKLNCKAIQELLLYYLKERIDYKNNNIKHLVITNGFEWYFFKAEDFYDTFYKNKELVKEYGQFRDKLKDSSKNELFYDEIAKKYIAKVENQIPFVYVDFKNKSISDLKQKEIVNIYKLFSDVHLLGKSFGNDSNQLNKAFYNELLHIIGLEEIKESGKKLIQRKKDKERDYASLLENAIFTLEDKDYLRKVKNVGNDENKPFNVGLELCLTWVNRILFLKLLESQLCSYNENAKEYKFLNFEFLNGFDALNELFFSALAKPLQDRHPRYAEKFKNIPYLNSSLFEKSELEDFTFDITALMDEEMNIYSSTVLKDHKGDRLSGKLNTLDYLFKFLDAYDFSTESGVVSDKHESKTLINASVLGLIFEKINGYKDGSFYTPGLITMFMCKETLRKSIIQKFKEEVNETIETFEDAKDYCQKYFKKDDIKRFNEVVNSIRICDPAVGSGHFLVSALNEMVAIKSELGILADENYNILPCVIEIENDELYISNANGELFDYIRKDPNSLRIQKSIFHEKETLIENCLFGVDINSNSVNICRLRLWIELLKNAYYTEDGELQTLPNIDINIKCGNALISRFSLHDSLKSALKKQNISVLDYKNAVSKYHKPESKDERNELKELIDNIKNNFRINIDNPFKRKMSVARGLVDNLATQINTKKQWNEKISTQLNKDYDNAIKKLKNLEEEKKQIEENKIYKNAFEWRFEFPEVLDDEGNFIGFDVIIGNPPYIRIQGIRENDSTLANEYMKIYDSATGAFDIYALFVENGLSLIKKKGIVNYIMPVKWTNAAFGSGLRQVILKNNSISKIINFGDFQAFDASTYTGLQWFEHNSHQLLYFELDKKYSNILELGEFLNNIKNDQGSIIPTNDLSKDAWILTNRIVFKIINKLNQQPRRISDVFDKIYQGIATSKDDVYFLYDCKIIEENVEGFSKYLNERVIIEKNFVKPLLKGDDVHRYEEIITNKYVIFPYDLKNDKAILYTEDKIQESFPNAYVYLKKCETALRDREKGRLKNDKFWYKYIYPKNLTLFDSEKLVAPEISLGGNFSYDKNGEFYSTTKIYGYIKKNTIKESYLFWLALFNSQLFWYFIQKTGYILRGGYFTFKTNYVSPFPLPNEFNLNSILEIEKLVKDIIHHKKNASNDDTKVLEKK